MLCITSCARLIQSPGAEDFAALALVLAQRAEADGQRVSFASKCTQDVQDYVDRVAQGCQDFSGSIELVGLLIHWVDTRGSTLERLAREICRQWTTPTRQKMPPRELPLIDGNSSWLLRAAPSPLPSGPWCSRHWRQRPGMQIRLEIAADPHEAVGYRLVESHIARGQELLALDQVLQDPALQGIRLQWEQCLGVALFQTSWLQSPPQS